MDSDTVVAFVVCGLPVFGFFFFLWLVTSAGRSSAIERRLAAQEEELVRVRQALRELHQRLSVVEGARRATERLESAPEALPAGEASFAAASAPAEPASEELVSPTPASVAAETAAGVGAPAATSGFGAPAATSGFAAPAATSGFAAPAATSGFGAPAATSGFGAAASGFGPLPPSQPTFGAPPASDTAAPEAATATTPEATESAPAMSLEQWLGVRGAAALGGILIAIAGAYWFQYSIEHGLVSPRVRVAIGVLVGLACVVGSESRLRTRNVTLANFLAGAGTAVLYFAFWAASARYGLVPGWLGMVGMAAVTAVGCVLSARHASLPTALLALGGGFATPIVLSSGEDRPIALFSYLFVLDAGLVYLARRQRWGALALLALGFTGFYEAGWVVSRMGPERVLSGLVVVSVFGAVFAAVPRTGADGEEVPGFRLTRALGILLPFTYGLHLSLASELPASFLPIGALLLFLNAGGAYLARRDVSPLLGTSTAAASMAVLAVHLVVRDLEASNAWWIALTTVLLAALHTGVAAWDRKTTGADPAASSTPPERDLSPEVATLGALTILLVHLVSSARLFAYPTIVSLSGLGLVLAYRARTKGREHLHYALGIALAWGLAGLHAKGATLPGFPPELAFLAYVAVVSIALAALGAFGPEAVRPPADRGATLAFLWLALHTMFVPSHAPFTLVEAAGLLLLFAFLVVVVAARRGHGLGLFAMALASGIASSTLGFEHHVDGASSAIFAALVVATTAVLALGPWLGGARLRGSLVAHRGAAFAAPMVLVTLGTLWEEHVGERGESVVALGLALLPTLAALLARRTPELDEGSRKSAFVWHATAALALVTAAIPLELDREWITVGWALQGVAVLVLWRSVDHAGLKAYAALLFAGVFIRLCLNPAVLGYHRADGLPIVNWLAYTYLVPAAAMLVGARLLRPLELERYRPLEKATFPASFPILASGLVLLALVTIFAWVNLAIVDAFSASRTLELPVSRMPARDLAISVAWAVYALVIVAIGVYKNNTGLRITSLCLLLLSSAKLFLYDLGNLRDLYRVFALLGLALVLIVVSFAYQRFVFRRDDSGR